MYSISIVNNDFKVFNRFGQFGQTKPIATATSNKLSCYFSAGSARVAALYPCRKAENAFTVKLTSHLQEMKEMQECVDHREAAIIKNANATRGLFRVRGV